jgi:hypothetical protein
MVGTDMRRVLWTIGVGFGAFFIGGMGGGVGGSVIGLIWGASIGYGFGTIFDQRSPTKWLVIYWATTLALVGPFFGLIVGAGGSDAQLVVAVGTGALGGMLFGLLVGTIQLRRLRRKCHSSESTSVV